MIGQPPIGAFHERITLLLEMPDATRFVGAPGIPQEDELEDDDTATTEDDATDAIDDEEMGAIEEDVAIEDDDLIEEDVAGTELRIDALDDDADVATEEDDLEVVAADDTGGTTIDETALDVVATEDELVPETRAPQTLNSHKE